jgi:hypothetical protein
MPTVLVLLSADSTDLNKHMNVDYKYFLTLF